MITSITMRSARRYANRRRWPGSFSVIVPALASPNFATPAVSPIGELSLPTRKTLPSPAYRSAAAAFRPAVIIVVQKLME